MNSFISCSLLRLFLTIGLIVGLFGCQSGGVSTSATYRLDQSSDLNQIRVEDFGFYGVRLPLLDGDRSGTDPVVLSASFRRYLTSWVDNLRGGGGSDYRYFEPIYLSTEEGFDFAFIPGEMSWLRRDGAGVPDTVREGLELKQSRMRVQATFAATPKDQLVRFLRFGVFRFEKAWFESNGWSYGAERGAGDHVYSFAGNPEGSLRAAEQRIVLGLKNEFIIVLGACDERDRAAMNEVIDRLLNELSFRKR